MCNVYCILSTLTVRKDVSVPDCISLDLFKQYLLT